jgi:hypothetical protein
MAKAWHDVKSCLVLLKPWLSLLISTVEEEGCFLLYQSAVAHLDIRVSHTRCCAYRESTIRIHELGLEHVDQAFSCSEALQESEQMRNCGLGIAPCPERLSSRCGNGTLVLGSGTRLLVSLLHPTMSSYCDAAGSTGAQSIRPSG